MKSYTDLEQSKKLEEILPIESADMFLAMNGTIPVMAKYIDDGYVTADETAIPCWSLVALLDILPDRTCVYKKTYKDGRVKYQAIAEGIKELILKDNPIDACVSMIERLNELNLL